MNCDTLFSCWTFPSSGPFRRFFTGNIPNPLGYGGGVPVQICEEIAVIFLFCIVFVIAAYGARLRHPVDSATGFLTRDFCDAVKGICILLVFIRHVWPYIEIAGYVSPPVIARMGSVVNGAIGQLLVAPFLFFSGFGVMESVLSKGDAYVRAMPKRRLLPTALNFDIAVLLFAALAVSLGQQVSVNRLLSALVGWSDVGNSNWYIFDIVVLYALFWVSFSFWGVSGRNSLGAKTDMRRSRILFPIASVTLLSSFLAVALWFSGKSGFWYNTILCFPAGVCFSFLSPLLLKQTTSPARFRKILIVFALAFCVAHALSRKVPPLCGNVGAVLFSLLVALLSAKLCIGNRALRWLGRNLFPLYIYHWIPMIAFSHIDGGHFAASHPFVFVMACLVSTFAIANAYPRFSIRFK